MRLAQELHQSAGVPLSPCGIEQAKLFQAYLMEYQINIVSKEYNNNIIYAGPEKDKRIYLCMHDNHYDVITKMPGFFRHHYYCHTCKKAYEHHEEHLCPNKCKCCGFLSFVLKSPGEVAKGSSPPYWGSNLGTLKVKGEWSDHYTTEAPY